MPKNYLFGSLAEPRNISKTGRAKAKDTCMTRLLQNLCDVRIIAICDNPCVRMISTQQVSRPAYLTFGPGVDPVAS